MLPKHSTCPQMVLSFRVITQEKSLKSNLNIRIPDELYSNALFPYFELLPSYVHSFNYFVYCREKPIKVPYNFTSFTYV